MRWRGFCEEILEVVRILDVRTVVTLGALVVVLSNLVTDIVYAYVDPRIRYE